jgi:hypothetical protein
MTQGDQQMSLAEANVAQEDGVGFLFDELQAEQILDLCSVDFLRPAPVELIEGFEDREARKTDAPLQTAVFAPIDFALDEPLQIIQMTPLLFGGGLRKLMMVLAQVRQLQT